MDHAATTAEAEPDGPAARRGVRPWTTVWILTLLYAVAYFDKRLITLLIVLGTGWATGLGGLQQAFTVSDVSGTVTVTYNYSGDSPTVPEPTTSLLGLFGAVMLMRRRQR